MAVIDLKLTKDLDNTYQDKFTPWFSAPWGDLSKMDKTQAYLYSYLWNLPFMYLVFDYKAEDAGWKPFPVQTLATHPDSQEAKTRHLELMRNVRFVLDRIIEWDSSGYRIEPSDACKKCPVLSCIQKNQITFA